MTNRNNSLKSLLTVRVLHFRSQVKKNKINMSPKRAGELTHNMYRLECILPGETLLSKILLGMDDEQKQLFKIVTDG
jgi:hypothetical protein